MNPEVLSPAAEEEDSTLLGGWLFADSFLALMIIFLATISFVPVLSSPEQTGLGSGGAVGGKVNVSEGLILSYQEFDATAIERDISAYASENNLRGNYEAIYTQVVGGYDSKTEEPFAGNLRAIDFSIKLREANLEVFRNSPFTVGNSLLVPAGKVVLRITLAEKVG